jgi:hypothetical protein
VGSLNDMSTIRIHGRYKQERYVFMYRSRTSYCTLSRSVGAAAHTRTNHGLYNKLDWYQQKIDLPIRLPKSVLCSLYFSVRI